MGEFLRGSPGPFVIATKAGIYTKPTRHFRNDRDSLRASLDGSLKRLGLDRVDLFYLHRREAARPLPEVIETLAGFVAEGLIGGYGLSEVAPATIREAHAIHPVTAVQSEYSLWTRLPELGVIRTCRELGIAFVPFSPVGRGILADRFPDPAAFPPEDFRRGNPRFEEPNYSRNKAAIAPFQAYCRSRGWATAAAAIAWLLDRGDHILPIPGPAARRTCANSGARRSCASPTPTAPRSTGSCRRASPTGRAIPKRRRRRPRSTARAGASGTLAARVPGAGHGLRPAGRAAPAARSGRAVLSATGIRA
jgi:aryl-alcohol dehydrogenase-like predicted oxidoreductase